MNGESLSIDPGDNSTVNSLASADVGINCMGPLGGKQGFQPYPSGPSQLSARTPLKNGRSNACTCVNIHLQSRVHAEFLWIESYRNDGAEVSFVRCY